MKDTLSAASTCPRTQRTEGDSMADLASQTCPRPSWDRGDGGRIAPPNGAEGRGVSISTRVASEDPAVVGHSHGPNPRRVTGGA